MNKLAIPMIIIIIAAVVVIPQTLFVVDETQLAIVTRFGQFKRAHILPGLQVKTPFVEQVTKFDRRLLRVDVIPASLLTEDKRNLVIDSYARYRIIDPLLFFQNPRNEAGADARVGDIVNAQLRQEVARDLQIEVISETREDIMRRVTAASNRLEISREELLRDFGTLDHPSVFVTIDEDTSDAEPGRPATQDELARLAVDGAALQQYGVFYAIDIRESLGIVIVDVRIKRADFPPDIETSVFSGMEAERELIASGLRAEATR